MESIQQPEVIQIKPEEPNQIVQSESKHFKEYYLCLTGAQPHMIEKDLVKFFMKNFNLEDLPLKGIMKKRGNNFAFFLFQDQEQMTKFKELFLCEIMPKMPKMRLKEVSKKMNAREFRPVKDREEMKEESERKKEKQMQNVTKEEIEEEMKISVEDRVTPYHNLEYKDQIKKKEQQLIDVLRSFDEQLKKDIKKNNEVKPKWYPETEQNIPCPLSEIIECDEDYINEYRNKVEFTVGRRYEDNEICVGFNKGNMNKGILYVDYPDTIKPISKNSIRAAKQLEKIIKESQIEPYDRKSNQGYWRILLYRESKKTKQVLICVVVSQENQVNEEQQLEIEQKLKTEFLSSSESSQNEYKTVSLSMIFSNEISGGYKETDRVKLLGGQDYYEEKLFDFNFRVSPFAFFQVNTNVFEKMLRLIEYFTQINENTVVLDICCGTGAIGICLSQKARKVIGVDIVESAIENAKANVQLNKDVINPDKCEYYAGRAEEVLPNLVKDQQALGLQIIGIVDPPRSGLHKDVLKALRTCKGLDRLVYVSCNPQSQMKDLQCLCYETSKKRKAPPFKPLQCIGADLFPHTNHIESIVLLERFYD
ncbi:tiny fragments locus 9c protein [Stylonychia lemnae]|uniref:Tinys locus 9c protein n=1 Tax=Stylonychia lemnae TaxID=5949 RepID=A0A078A984_STYLE|nr:tiny fragments locus 9c protein [Stylonychia lemnae]